FDKMPRLSNLASGELGGSVPPCRPQFPICHVFGRIRDPSFEISPYLGPHCRIRSPQDTNPTAALVTAVDCDGRIYCLSEYYQPGLTPSQHMDNLRSLPGFLDAERICADPSIFYRTQAQSEGGFKSIADTCAASCVAG